MVKYAQTGHSIAVHRLNHSAFLRLQCAKLDATKPRLMRCLTVRLAARIMASSEEEFAAKWLDSS
jgi:hypothetical protein